LLVDVSGLDDGAPTTDSGADAIEVSTEDAATDGSAQVDAIADAEAGLPFCQAAQAASSDASPMLFCDDFDDVGRTSFVAGGWSVAYQSPVLTNDTPFSTPLAGRATFTTEAGEPGRALGAFTVPFDPARTTLTISARMRPRVDYQGGVVELFIGGCTLAWASGYVDNHCPAVGTTFSGAAAFVEDKWTRLEIKLTRTSATAIEIQTTNGEGAAALVSVGTLDVSDGGSAYTGNVTGLTIGFGETGGDLTGTVDFDNVLVTVE
jgi:hypothetical protein